MCLHLTLMSFRSIRVLPVLDTFVLIFIRLDALTFHANTVQIFEEEKKFFARKDHRLLSKNFYYLATNIFSIVTIVGQYQPILTNIFSQKKLRHIACQRCIANDSVTGFTAV